MTLISNVLYVIGKVKQCWAAYDFVKGKNGDAIYCRTIVLYTQLIRGGKYIYYTDREISVHKRLYN